MQKTPILPTTPWQGGDPIFSTPSVAAARTTPPRQIIWFLSGLISGFLVLIA